MAASALAEGNRKGRSGADGAAVADKAGVAVADGAVTDGVAVAVADGADEAAIAVAICMQ